jgi:hypothetical protein
MAVAKRAFMTLTRMTRYSNSNLISKWTKSIAFAGALVIAGWAIAFAAPNTPTAGVNARVTLDNGGSGAYMSADQLAGGTYTDAVLQRCGTDRRQQNEPTLAIDPRNTSIWASGANEYCTTPVAGDAWAGFYRSTDSGRHWADSLLPATTATPQSKAQVHLSRSRWRAALWLRATR